MIPNVQKWLAYLNPQTYLKTRSTLGLDFSAGELRLLHLQKKGESLHVENLLSQPLPPAALLPSGPPRWDVIQPLLKDLVDQAGLKGLPAAFALESHQVQRKWIQLPAYLKEKDLPGEVQQRLLEYFPNLHQKELYFDCRLRYTAADLHHLLLVATPKSQVEAPLHLLAEVGLSPSLIDINLYALARAARFHFYPRKRLLPEHPEEALAHLSLEAVSGSLLIFQEEELHFHHSFSLDPLFLKEPEVHFAAFFKDLAEVLALASAANPHLRIKALGLSGAKDLLLPLKQPLSEKLSLPVSLLNPFSSMTYSPELSADSLSQASHRFLLCCGLALREPFQ